MGYTDIHFGVEDSVSVFGALVLFMVWLLVACGAVLVATGQVIWHGSWWAYDRIRDDQARARQER